MRKCATPGCDRRERWISIWTPRVRREPYRRHCAECCDRIDHLMRVLRGEES